MTNKANLYHKAISHGNASRIFSQMLPDDEEQQSEERTRKDRMSYENAIHEKASFGINLFFLGFTRFKGTNSFKTCIFS